jgi:hypothetical protein
MVKIDTNNSPKPVATLPTPAIESANESPAIGSIGPFDGDLAQRAKSIPAFFSDLGSAIADSAARLVSIRGTSASLTKPVTIGVAPPKGSGADVFPGIPFDAPISSSPDARSRADYDAVLDQFKVSTNPRYTPNRQGKNETYCNIFVSDATAAMGAALPTAYDDKTGKPMTWDAKAGVWKGTGYEHDANGMVDWLDKFGPSNGWKKVTAEEAQKSANAGKPAVAAWKNVGGIGHVAMVRPDSGTFDPANGPKIAQAGGTNFDQGYVKDGFKGCPDKKQIEYWVHD